jgi:ABC-type transport system involved in cytochrome c biogenesis permease component
MRSHINYPLFFFFFIKTKFTYFKTSAKKKKKNVSSLFFFLTSLKMLPISNDPKKEKIKDTLLGLHWAAITGNVGK